MSLGALRIFVKQILDFNNGDLVLLQTVAFWEIILVPGSLVADWCPCCPPPLILLPFSGESG